ncbi:hypothetical protein CRP01_04140 [Flavilitoribacter nigricans DSM 23189 = NBRC 102662]|uniref:Cytochrome c domain-containing protein n=2 Tax=Flavilitoribacter TaxID=2762562 RepID=A0A2D0NHH7_FLAN2|nr:hypothetical protein CRP01_04140 [Flavilitoribacter nigricans DSM 23189 = NBRC 102662]
MLMILPFVLLLPACYYDVEEELYPDTGCATDNVTYSGTILPILESNCFICHSEAAKNGNVILEGYDNLKGHVDSGRLLGAIRHEAGFSPMPQNQPQLVDCVIEKIETWIEDGAPDN